MIVIVRRVRGVPIAPGCGRLLHRNHRSAVRRFARAAAPAIEHHPVQPIAARAAATRPPRSQVGLDPPSPSCATTSALVQLGTTLQALGAQLVNSVVDCAV